MIDAIFFDFDGVLTTDFNGSTTIVNNLCDAERTLTPANVLPIYKKHCGKLAQGGAFTDVWKNFCQEIGCNISVDVLRDALRHFPRNNAMFALAASLRQRYRVGMITDNPTERIALLREELADFDPLIVSGDVHASKSDGSTTIFDAALRTAHCTANRAIFIDNQARNLVTPSAMGMKTFLHDHADPTTDALQGALRSLGVIVESESPTPLRHPS